MNNVDILYYESMIDIVSENRKIMEFITGSNIEMKTIAESSQLAIYEANVIETIKNSIKEIFKKVIDFFRGLFKKVTNGDFFKVDEKLIKACNEKLKNMSSNDKNGFIVEGISIRGALIDRQKDVNQYIKECNEDMNTLFQNTNWLSDQKMDQLKAAKENLQDESKSFDDITSDKDTFKKQAKNVDIKTVEICLDPSLSSYADSKKVIENLKSEISTVENSMKSYERKTEQFIEKNKNEYTSESINLYRSVIYLYTNCMMKAYRALLSLIIAQFKNEEQILRAFMAYKPHNESVEFQSDLFMENGDLLDIIEGAMKDKYEDQQEYRTDPNREQGHTRDEKEWEKRKNSKNDKVEK